MKKIYPTVAVLSLLLLFTGLILAQVDRPAQGKLQTFNGELTRVDATEKALWVKGSDGKEMGFRYTDQTEITGAEGGIEGLAGKSGTRVRVHFDPASQTASKIEVLQSKK